MPAISGRDGNTGGGGRGNGRDRDQVTNLHPIQRLHLLLGENTRGVLRTVSLPIINGCVLCKRFHLGLMCYTSCPRARSHIHPPITAIDTVATALKIERVDDANS